MKVALICPSNILYMPYVDNYVKVLKENNTDYIIINWDRFRIEEISEFTYRDNKVGHQRNFLDYYGYYKFVVNILTKNYFDKIIVFGLQITYFLKRYLIKNFENKYIIDIRDYNKILKMFNPRRVIENSTFTVISSPGYRQWLPKHDKYIINHNTQISSLDELKNVDYNYDNNKIKISCIGAIRDLETNIDLIKALCNKQHIYLYYHGEGVINDKIIKYLRDNCISNVLFTGRYEKKEEQNLYLQSDLINVLRYNDNINNYTALPNRLYNSVLYGKPMVACEGTYLAKIIEEYDLGLVLNSLENVDKNINNYLMEFDINIFNERRINFFINVINENQKFRKKLKEFILNIKSI